MKKTFFSAALPALAIALVTLSPVGDPLPIGASLPNPEAKMKDISGKEISFKDATKKNGLLVMFSCNTCPIVKGYQGRTLEAAKHALGNDVGVILLNPNEATRGDGDSFDDMKEYGKDQGYSFSYVLDKNSTMADAFGANRTPECFLFDKNGKLVYHGAIDDNAGDPAGVSRKHLIKAIDEVKAGQPVSVKESRSVGCTIKRA
ncbi:MAG: thioredoxin family protein [Chitinophagaceae bacterium]